MLWAFFYCSQEATYTLIILYRRLKTDAKSLVFLSFALTLHKIGCTREIENKFSFRSFALSLHKIGCTRETENEFSFRSFALSLHITRNIPKSNDEKTTIYYCYLRNDGSCRFCPSAQPRRGRKQSGGQHPRQYSESLDGSPRTRFKSQGKQPGAVSHRQLYHAQRYARQRQQRPMGMGIL